MSLYLYFFTATFTYYLLHCFYILFVRAISNPYGMMSSHFVITNPIKYNIRPLQYSFLLLLLLSQLFPLLLSLCHPCHLVPHHALLLKLRPMTSRGLQYSGRVITLRVQHGSLFNPIQFKLSPNGPRGSTSESWYYTPIAQVKMIILLSEAAAPALSTVQSLLGPINLLGSLPLYVAPP